MRSSFALALVLPLLSTVSATPVDIEGRNILACTTGLLQCCDSLVQSTTGVVGTLGGLLGLTLPLDITGLVGLGCTPLNLVGRVTGGAACVAQPACCTGTAAGGLLTVGCTPVAV